MNTFSRFLTLMDEEGCTAIFFTMAISAAWLHLGWQMWLSWFMGLALLFWRPTSKIKEGKPNV